MVLAASETPLNALDILWTISSCRSQFSAVLRSTTASPPDKTAPCWLKSWGITVLFLCSHRRESILTQVLFFWVTHYWTRCKHSTRFPILDPLGPASRLLFGQQQQISTSTVFNRAVSFSLCARCALGWLGAKGNWYGVATQHSHRISLRVLLKELSTPNRTPNQP
jgi:hypothetical protein